MINICVFILTRNRSVGAKLQVERAIESGIGKDRIILSDNSTNSNVRKNLEGFAVSKGVKFCRRDNLPTVFDHMKHCVSETSEDYVMFLHDDDIIELDIFSNYEIIINKFDAIDAVVGRNKINGKHYDTFKAVDDYTVVSLETLVEQYTYGRDPYNSSFPFYLFRTSSIKDALDSHHDLGVYSDFSLLLDIIIKGGVVIWTEKIVGSYGWHGNNLSSHVDMDARIKMVNLLVQTQARKLKFEKVFGWFFTLFTIDQLKNFNFQNFVKVKKYFMYINFYEITLYACRLIRIRRCIKR